MLRKIEHLFQKFDETHERSAPIIYSLIGSFLLSFLSLVTKFLSHIHSPQILYFRSLIFLFFNTHVLKMGKVEVYQLTESTFRKIMARSLFGAIAGLFYFEGLKYLPLSEATVLVRTAPIWTALIAIYILKQEKGSILLLLTSLVCFIGILLVSRPSYIQPFLKYIHLIEKQETQNSKINEDSSHFLGIIFMLSTAILMSLVQVMISKLSGKTNQFVILQYFAISALLVSSFIPLYNQSQEFVYPNSQEVFYLIVVGAVNYFSQIFTNLSFLKGDLTVISMVGQASVLFSFLLDIVVLRSEISLCSVIGTLLILGSLIFLVILKNK